MNQDRESDADRLRREMFIHLNDLRDQCDRLIAAKYPLDVYNQTQTLRSLVGQIASAADRYHRTSRL